LQDTFATDCNQAQVSVNVNLGNPPSWGPVGLLLCRLLLPDIEAYYDIRATQFIYFGGGRWIRSRNLPNQYRNYNLTMVIKFLNDYRGSRPYSNFKSHKVKYYKGYKENHKIYRFNQVIIPRHTKVMGIMRMVIEMDIKKMDIKD
jgi:hypothetical protein